MMTNQDDKKLTAKQIADKAKNKEKELKKLAEIERQAALLKAKEFKDQKSTSHKINEDLVADKSSSAVTADFQETNTEPETENTNDALVGGEEFFKPGSNVDSDMNSANNGSVSGNATGGVSDEVTDDAENSAKNQSPHGHRIGKGGAVSTPVDHDFNLTGSGGAGSFTNTTAPLSAAAINLQQLTNTQNSIDLANNNSGNNSGQPAMLSHIPVLTINVDAISADNVVNASESGTNLDVTGTVGGEFATGDTVTFAVNGTDYSGTVDSQGHFSIAVLGSDLAADKDTQFTASVSHTDAAGNTGSITANHTYSVDTSAPNAPVIDPIPTDGNNPTPTITGTGEVGATLTITDGGTNLGTAVVGQNGQWTFTTPALTDGPHALSATQTDTSGNTSGSSTGHSTNVDTATPVLTIAVDAITADNVVNSAESGTNLDVTGTVGGEFATGDTVTFAVNGTDYSGTVDNTGHFSISVAGSDLKADPDTQFTASVSHTDAAGNTGTSTVAYSYNVDTSINASADVNTAKEEQSPTSTQGNVLTNDDQNGTSVTTGDVVGTYGTFHFKADGSYIYELDNSKVQSFAEGSIHDDHATYTITDTAGNITSASLKVSIEGTNDSPTLAVTNLAAKEDGLSVKGAATFTDVDATDTHAFTVSTMASGEGAVSIDATTGEYTFTPGKDFQTLAVGETKDVSFNVTINDGHGGTDTEKVTVTVTGTNDQPTITAQSMSSNEDSDYQFTAANFGFTDVDSTDTLDHISITSLPDATQGELLLNGVAVSANQQIDNADIANLTFKPAANFNGDVQLSYTVNDGHSDSAPSTSTLTVANVNDLPTVVETTQSTQEDTDIIITTAQLLSGSSDVDSGDVLNINNVTVNGGHGAVTDNGNGTWTLHPDSNFKGDITLNYKVNDGHADVDNHMTVNVTSVTDGANISLTSDVNQEIITTGTAGRIEIDNIKAAAPLTEFTLEMTVIGKAVADTGAGSGPVVVNMGQGGDTNILSLWNPGNMKIGGAGNVATGINLGDGNSHRVTLTWDSTSGDLKVFDNGVLEATAANFHKGGTLPADMYMVLGSKANHGIASPLWQPAEHYEGSIFNTAIASEALTPDEVALGPLASLRDKSTGLLVDVRSVANRVQDTTGTLNLAENGVGHELHMVDTSVGVPPAGSLVNLHPTFSSPDGDDKITAVSLHGLLQGTVLSDGTNSHTISNINDTVDIKDWDLTHLTAQLPAGVTQNMNVGITLTTQGPDGQTAAVTEYTGLKLDPTQPVPNAIIGGDISGTVDEVSSIDGQLTVTDTDVNQDHFVAQVLPSAHGDFTVEENGHWTFTPNKDAQTLTQGNSATDIVTVKTVDGSEQQISVRLTGSDTAPTAVTTDLGKVESGNAHTITVAELLANVTDVDTPDSGLSIVSGSLTSAHGSFTENPDGSFSFTAEPGFVGKDLAIQFTVTDGYNNTDATAHVDVVTPLAITHLGNDTGVSDSDFITSDGRLVVYGTGEPGATVTGLGILAGHTAVVDEHGNWQLDASAIDQPDNTISLSVYQTKGDGSLDMANHNVTIDTAKPTISIDPISTDDWVDHNEHSQDLTISGDSTNVHDGGSVDVTIAGKHYSAIVNHDQWQVVIPATDTVDIKDNNYQVHAEVVSAATGDTASSERHVIVSASLSTLVQNTSATEDTKTSANGTLFTPEHPNTVTSTGDLQGNYGSLHLNTDGSYHYTLNNHDSDVQQLAEGDQQADNFFVSYTNAHGDIKHAILNVGIHGTNDVPLLTGTFEISRSVTTGFKTHTHSLGHVDIHDADKGDSLSYEYTGNDGVSHSFDFSSTLPTEIEAQGIGNFSIKPDGSWEFVLSKSGPERDAMNTEIASGKVHTESVVLKVTDSSGASREETLTVHIGDGKTGPQIFGSSESVVTEDKVTQSQGLLDLLVADVKVESGVTWEIQPSSQPQYGDLTLNSDGSWQYQAHNSDQKVQGLAEGERLEETVMVTATDTHGHSVDQAMKLVIIGTNDVPVVAHQLSSTVVEDHLLTLTKAQLLANVQDADTTDHLDISNLHLIGGGTITPEGDHWVVNPGLDYSGELRLSYQVSDGHVSIDNAMAIKVAPDADTPTMIFTKHVGDLSSPLDSFSIAGNENTDLALNINVSSPDSSETLSVEITGIPSGAKLSAGTEQNGVWTLQQSELTNLKVIPEHDYNGNFDIHVKAISHDGTGTASAEQQIGVNVIPAISHVAGNVPTLTASSETTQFNPTLVEDDFTTTQTSTGIELLGYQTSDIMKNGHLDVDAASSLVVAHNQNGVGVDGAGTSGSDAEINIGETLLLRLQGTARSAVIQLSNFDNATTEKHSSSADDKAHWTAYDEHGQLVAEGDVSPSLTDNGQFEITSTSAFAFITLQAVDNGKTNNHFSVKSAEADLIQYNTKVDLHGQLTGVSSTAHISYSVEGLGDTASFDHGIKQADGSWLITEADVNDLHLQHTGNVSLTITAVAEDGSTSTSSQPATLDITTDSMNYTLVGGVHKASVDEDNTQGISERLDIESNVAGEHTFVAQNVTDPLGDFALSKDGHWTFNVNTSAIQDMNVQDTKIAHFTAVTDTGETREINVDIVGKDDPSVLGGTLIGSVTEDSSTEHQATGHLTLTDVDNVVSAEPFFPVPSYSGTYGTLSVKSNGDWTYTLDDTKADALNDGQVVQEHFDHILTDNAMLGANGAVTINITGHTDSPSAAPAPAPSAIPEATQSDEQLVADAETNTEEHIQPIESNYSELTNPVDHYLSMIGVNKDDIQVNDQSSMSDDTMQQFDIPDTSSDADPLLDSIDTSTVDNPLSDKDDNNSIDDIFDQELPPQLDDNHNDDDSLSQALTDMHSQF